MTPRRVGESAAIASVARLASLSRTAWVGVDGHGGAGKSSLAARIVAAVPQAVTVCIDDFAGPRVAEWDWDRFRAQVSLPLLAGRPARYQRWDWNRDAGAEWHDVAIGHVVVVEGVSSTRDEAAVPWDLTIWVETPRAIRLARAMARDGAAMQSTWRDRWLPSEERYIARQAPQQRVDLIVAGTERGGQ